MNKDDDRIYKIFLYIFASIWSMFSMVYIIGITFFDIPKENVRFADSIMSFMMGTIVATIMNFFFGSSKGSKEKTDAIIDMKK